MCHGEAVRLTKAGPVCRAEGALLHAGEGVDDLEDDVDDEEGKLGEPSVLEQRRDTGQSSCLHHNPLNLKRTLL